MKTKGELEDELKARDRLVAELRDEIDELRDQVRGMEEHVEDARLLIENWAEAFDMEMTDDGWSLAPWCKTMEALADKYAKLLREWNALVPRYNALVSPPRNVGRPLQASDAQRASVLNLRQGQKSLRAIAEETNLGLQTVRTIIDGRDRRDRTTVKHMARVEIDRASEKIMAARIRTVNALPKRAQATIEAGQELMKRAKGLARVRAGQ